MTPQLLLLLQAIDPSGPRDLGLYIADAAALGAFGFAWRTNARLARIETILTERRSGVVDTVVAQGALVAENGKMLARHESRLDGHDSEIERATAALAEERRHRVRRQDDREREEA